ncbi:MAG TPA: tyrosine-type recombinase/integrase [Stellaceae bacterium]|nr:tyrosine-type recombinase/integrase [Stellaceae bacterium]
MSDFLTRRGGVWHFVRRVPIEFAAFDPRRVVRHSTGVKVADDRIGRRAARVALTLSEELECFWKILATGQSGTGLGRYDEVRRRARSLGYDFIPNGELVALPAEKRLERLESLVARGLVNDAGARQVILGTAPIAGFSLSRLFDEFEAITQHENIDLSPDQLRIWRNSRRRAVAQFADIVGDKPITELSFDDGMNYVEWWRDRVVDNKASVKTANKDLGQLSRMLKEMSIRRRLNLPEIFKGLHLRGEVDKSRLPYDPAFIQTQLLGSALAGLNEDARFVLYVMIETGLRPSEIVNLRENTILLGASIPYIRITADGRRLKTEHSEREIPLVGVALKVLQRRPAGFPKYHDNATGLSATVNKYLIENDLRPTKDHTLYSLRHSFKDRLVAAEAPDSLIDSLMGHKTYKPKYGKGPPLELKLKYLAQIALRTPDRL